MEGSYTAFHELDARQDIKNPAEKAKIDDQRPSGCGRDQPDFGPASFE